MAPQIMEMSQNILPVGGYVIRYVFLLDQLTCILILMMISLTSELGKSVHILSVMIITGTNPQHL